MNHVEASFPQPLTRICSSEAWKKKDRFSIAKSLQEDELQCQLYQIMKKSSAESTPEPVPEAISEVVQMMYFFLKYFFYVFFLGGQTHRKISVTRQEDAKGAKDAKDAADTWHDLFFADISVQCFSNFHAFQDVQTSF